MHGGRRKVLEVGGPLHAWCSDESRAIVTPSEDGGGGVACMDPNVVEVVDMTVDTEV